MVLKAENTHVSPLYMWGTARHVLYGRVNDISGNNCLSLQLQKDLSKDLNIVVVKRSRREESHCESVHWSPTNVR